MNMCMRVSKRERDGMHACGILKREFMQIQHAPMS